MCLLVLKNASIKVPTSKLGNCTYSYCLLLLSNEATKRSGKYERERERKRKAEFRQQHNRFVTPSDTGNRGERMVLIVHERRFSPMHALSQLGLYYYYYFYCIGTGTTITIVIIFIESTVFWSWVTRSTRDVHVAFVLALFRYTFGKRTVPKKNKNRDYYIITTSGCWTRERLWLDATRGLGFHGWSRKGNPTASFAKWFFSCHSLACLHVLSSDAISPFAFLGTKYGTVHVRACTTVEFRFVFHTAVTMIYYIIQSPQGSRGGASRIRSLTSLTLQMYQNLKLDS